jgi:undecaprenyl-diphosphatase
MATHPHPLLHAGPAPALLRQGAAGRGREAGLFALEAALLAAVVVLALVVHAVRYALPGDLGLAEFVQLLLPHKQLSAALDLLSTVGWPQFAAPLLAGIVVLLAMLRRRLSALCALVLVALADGSNFLIDNLVHRPRPAAPGLHVLRHIGNYYSFPSGHVEHFTVLCGFLFFLTYAARRPGPRLVVLRIVLGLLVVLMGVSRLLEGEHWPSDVLAGYLLGAFWLVAGVHAYRWLWRRWPRLRGANEREVPHL